MSDTAQNELARLLMAQVRYMGTEFNLTYMDALGALEMTKARLTEAMFADMAKLDDPEIVEE